MKSQFKSTGLVADLGRVDENCRIPGLLGGDWATYRQLVDSKRKTARIADSRASSRPASDLQSPNSQLVVVEVCVFWIPAPSSPIPGLHQPWSECSRIVVQRVMASAPESKVTERLNDACDDYVAKRLLDPAWQRFASGWATPVCEEMASAAETVSGLHDQLHELVLGRSIENLTGLKLLADIGAEVALPGDGLFRTAKLLIQGAGIVMGLLTHQPLLLNACLKSFTHDAALHALSRGVGDLLADTCSPVRAGQEITSSKQASKATNYDNIPLTVDRAGTTKSRSGSPEHPDQPHMNRSVTTGTIPVIVNDAGTTPSTTVTPHANSVRISPSVEPRLP